jgi:very-short-patch-repair endonuclease
MAARNIVRGGHLSETKHQCAKMLRKDMTPEETMLWQCLRGNRLEGIHFRRQQVIEGYIVDFYCHAAGVVIEVDGEGHLQQREYDEARDEMLAAKGLTILRFSNHEVCNNLSVVISRILEACR